MRIAVDALKAQSKEFPDQIVRMTEVGWRLALRMDVIVAIIRLML